MIVFADAFSQYMFFAMLCGLGFAAGITWQRHQSRKYAQPTPEPPPGARAPQAAPAPPLFIAHE